MHGVSFAVGETSPIEFQLGYVSSIHIALTAWMCIKHTYTHNTYSLDVYQINSYISFLVNSCARIIC